MSLSVLHLCFDITEKGNVIVPDCATGFGILQENTVNSGLKKNP